MKGTSHDNDNQMSEHKRTPKKLKTRSNVTTTIFQEDGDTIELEVNGQSTEFTSEGEITVSETPDEEEEESELEDEEVLVSSSSMNNNATREKDYTEMNDSMYSEDSEVQIKPRDEDAVRKQEETETQKFIDYMKK